MMNDERMDLATDMRACIHRWLRIARRKPRVTTPRRAMSFGFSIADGTGAYGEPAFVLVTPGGESVALTHDLLAALEGRVVLMTTDVVVTLGSGGPKGIGTQPVRKLTLSLALGVERARPEDFCVVESTVEPSRLFSPWTFLTDRRPDGWPA